MNNNLKFLDNKLINLIILKISLIFIYQSNKLLRIEKKLKFIKNKYT